MLLVLLFTTITLNCAQQFPSIDIPFPLFMPSAFFLGQFGGIHILDVQEKSEEARSAAPPHAPSKAPQSNNPDTTRESHEEDDNPSVTKAADDIMKLHAVTASFSQDLAALPSCTSSLLKLCKEAESKMKDNPTQMESCRTIFKDIAQKILRIVTEEAAYYAEKIVTKSPLMDLQKVHSLGACSKTHALPIAHMTITQKLFDYLWNKKPPLPIPSHLSLEEKDTEFNRVAISIWSAFAHSWEGYGPPWNIFAVRSQFIQMITTIKHIRYLILGAYWTEYQWHRELMPDHLQPYAATDDNFFMYISKDILRCFRRSREETSVFQDLFTALENLLMLEAFHPTTIPNEPL